MKSRIGFDLFLRIVMPVDLGEPASQLFFSSYDSCYSVIIGTLQASFKLRSKLRITVKCSNMIGIKYEHSLCAA